VAFLQRRLSWMQWFSCFTLIVGIVLVQRAGSNVPPKAAVPPPSQPGAAGSAAGGVTPGREHRLSLPVGDPEDALVGLFAALIGSLASCGAGIYIEKVLKSRENKMAADIELAMRNIQLSLYGFVFSLFTGYIAEGQSVLARGDGWFAGFNLVVWAVVALQVLGGLLHTLGLKHADNIFCSYANSASVILSAVASMALFNFNPSYEFYIGAFIVMGSTYLYAKGTQADYDPLVQEAAVSQEEGQPLVDIETDILDPPINHNKEGTGATTFQNDSKPISDDVLPGKFDMDSLTDIADVTNVSNDVESSHGEGSPRSPTAGDRVARSPRLRAIEHHALTVRALAV